MATPREIRAAYLRLIKKYHPDAIYAFHHRRQESDEQNAREINAAYADAKRLFDRREASQRLSRLLKKRRTSGLFCFELLF